MHPDPWRRNLNRRMEDYFGWLVIFDWLYLAVERCLRWCRRKIK